MRSQPALGVRYWSALCLASIFGCNTGDVLAEDGGLGHWRGLPILAVAFALTLWGERRSRRPNQGWYWLAIVLVRTAATNIADLTVHDAQLPYGIALTLFATVLFAVGLIGARRTRSGAMPAADATFWTGMFAAGTFGTALGDDLAFERGWGLDAASIATSLAAAVALAPRAWPAARLVATFWIAVVAIRTAGTNVGDLLARHITLEASTLVSGAALSALLLLRHPHRVAPREATGRPFPGDQNVRLNLARPSQPAGCAQRHLLRIDRSDADPRPAREP